MTFFNIPYFSGKALESIKRNPFINLITIGVIAIAFLIFASFLMLFSNLNTILALWEEEVQIEAYIQEKTGASEIDEAMRLLVTMAGVKDVSYVSKDDALERFKESMGGMGAIVSDLDENPLPASFKIRLDEDFRNFNSVEKIAREMEKLKGIDEVIYGQEWVKRFSTSLAIVRLTGLVIGAFLLMSTIFIVSNTIKLTVYAKKEELEISRLLGATNTFIKFPFCIEGLLQGLAGSGISVLTLYLAYKLFVVKMSSSIEASFTGGAFQVSFLSTSEITYILAGGMALGIFGSFVSLGRFLKV